MADGLARYWSVASRWLPFVVMPLALLQPIQRTAGHDFRDLGIDAHVYYHGAAAWLAGQDPWNAAFDGLHFASLPWTLPLLVPFVALPERIAAALAIGIDAVAAAYLVRRAGLPYTWLLFPPLVFGTLDGNPAIVALALIVAGAGPIGVLLRPQLGYALVGERRWRAIGVTALLVAILLPVVPWGTYLADFGAISARYVHEGGGGTTGGSTAMLVVGLVAVLGLATVSWREAGWLATVVVVPLNGWYAGAAAILFINPLLAIGFAPQIVDLPTITVVVYVMLRLLLHRRPATRLAWVARSLIEPYHSTTTAPTASPRSRLSFLISG